MEDPVRVLLFAAAREAVGASHVDVRLPDGDRSVASLLALLRAKYPRLTPVLASARLVKNGTYLRSERTKLAPGDELAIHPPYGGG